MACELYLKNVYGCNIYDKNSKENEEMQLYYYQVSTSFLKQFNTKSEKIVINEGA